MAKLDLNAHEKFHVHASWCVVKNIKDGKISVMPGGRGFYTRKFKVLFQNDDMIACKKYQENYVEDPTEVIVDYSCLNCHNRQLNSFQCKKCASRKMEPNWA